MGKKNKKKKNESNKSDATKKPSKGKSSVKSKVAQTDAAAATTAKAELSGKEYSRELRKLHVELVKLQEWVKLKGLKVCIVFEGRDRRGKGGTIKRSPTA